MHLLALLARRVIGGWLIVGWTIRQAIDSLIRKAGWKGALTESTRLSLAVTRYQSTNYTLSYTDFQSASTCEE